MKSASLLGNLKFGDADPHAEPIYSAKVGRAILFTLRPGQSIREHNAPSTPLFVVVLRGEGVFAGSDGIEHTYGPNMLLVFDPGENHFIRAVSEELVFVGILHGAPLAQK